jgi:nodulation ATP-binding protein I
MERLIKIEKLSKSFGEQKVLDKIDFNLESGEIVGLIGPSGSGKSTLIKTMLGMEKADEGEALILDYKMPKREILSNIGYMAQSDALYEMLTGYENLEFFGKMKGVPSDKLKKEIEYIAEIVDLTDDLKKLVSNYSGGMKRRLSLAIALIGSPELLILDEPTVGIDPSLRKNIWKELFKQRDNGVGILVTTHVMDEAELTDKVGLLLNGDIIDFDTPQQLKVKNNVKTIEEVFLKVEEN